MIFKTNYQTWIEKAPRLYKPLNADGILTLPPMSPPPSTPSSSSSSNSSTLVSSSTNRWMPTGSERCLRCRFRCPGSSPLLPTELPDHDGHVVIINVVLDDDNKFDYDDIEDIRRWHIQIPTVPYINVTSFLLRNIIISSVQGSMFWRSNVVMIAFLINIDKK